MAKNWMGGIKSNGSFRRKAEKAGKTTREYAAEEKHDTKHPHTMHQAQAAANMMSITHHHHK